MARRLSAALSLYRIADRRYPLFSGHAAGQIGFRWNPKGIEVVYASVTLAGAMLEKLVHTGTGRVPQHQVVVTITVPAGMRVDEIDPDAHPERRRFAVSQRIGKRWFLRRETAVLLVPSVVFEGQNAVINPLHPDASRLRISRPRAVRWDKRLFADET